MTTQLTVYAAGQGSVSADQMNTWVQGTALASDLENFIGVTGMMVLVTGTTVANDGGQSWYVWSASARGPTSLPTVIIPTGVAVAGGGWVQVPGAVYTPPLVPTGTIEGNNTGNPSAPIALTPAQATAMLSVFAGDGGGNLKGLVPAPPAGSSAKHEALMAAGDFEAVGYVGVPVDVVTLPHTLVETDVGKTRSFSTTGTVTIPAGLTVGDVFDLIWTSGVGTIALSGATLINPVGGGTPTTVTGPGSITVQCIAANAFWLRGGQNVT
jgi:hypothetical protein